jgi:hypothetical protein
MTISTSIEYDEHGQPIGYKPAQQRQAGEQPAPQANENSAIWPIVIQEMAARDAVGRERYGVPLQPHNGRDMLRDAYEEALDLCCYLRGAMYERDGK